MPWRETRSGTLLRHMSAYQTRSLMVGRTMQLAMLMLALALQARLSSSSRQAPQFWTSATLTSNACDTVGWRTPSPNRGCAEPTKCPSPWRGEALVTTKEGAAITGRKPRRKRMSACAQELVLHSLQLSQHKYDSRPRPDLPVAQRSPKQQLGLACHGLKVLVQRSHSPGLYSGIPSLSCSLSHRPSSQCTYTYMPLLRYQQQATDSRTAGPPRCLTDQGHHHVGRLGLHAVWQFLHMHSSWAPLPHAH